MGGGVTVNYSYLDLKSAAVFGGGGDAVNERAVWGGGDDCIISLTL